MAQGTVRGRYLASMLILTLMVTSAGCLVAAVGVGAYGGYMLGTDPRSPGEIITDDVITARGEALGKRLELSLQQLWLLYDDRRRAGIGSP